MGKLIKLTSQIGDHTLVNPDHIICAYPRDDRSKVTIILLGIRSDRYSEIRVAESVDEIYEIVNGQER